MNPFPSRSPEVLDVDPQTAAQLIADGAVLLDVREPDEWAAGLPVVGADGRPGTVA